MTEPKIPDDILEQDDFVRMIGALLMKSTMSNTTAALRTLPKRPMQLYAALMACESSIAVASAVLDRLNGLEEPRKRGDRTSAFAILEWITNDLKTQPVKETDNAD